MPNAGKSTLFNALTAARRGDRRLPLHDCRAERRGRPGARMSASSGSPETLRSSEVVQETIDFHDIAGPRQGRLAGRGPGEPVPRIHPREPMRFCHVIRAHGAGAVAHPRGPDRSGRRRRADRDRAARRRPGERRAAASSASPSWARGGAKDFRRRASVGSKQVVEALFGRTPGSGGPRFPRRRQMRCASSPR